MSRNLLDDLIMTVQKIAAWALINLLLTLSGMGIYVGDYVLGGALWVIGSIALAALLIYGDFKS